ncbi:unnamed protein product [Gongylonema pulchrum]|uniref:Protein quiver n=1 Tax=Gongylonema pulchrum TaxID=637853 RepID=A0A183DPB7_9BILA|nr:unnamed protein product [Gongylonema pulchrum]
MKQSPFIQFTFGILALTTSLQYGECLRCYTCDGPHECANPREEQCPKNNECFTVAENYDVKQNGVWFNFKKKIKTWNPERMQIEAEDSEKVVRQHAIGLI